MARSMNEIATEIHAWAERKGWWEVPAPIVKAIDLDQVSSYESRDDYIPAHEWVRLKIIMEKLALIGTEISEAIEELRNGHGENEIYYLPSGKPEGFPIELADAIIRIFNLMAFCKIDIDRVVEQKMAYNESREYRHGGKLA